MTKNKSGVLCVKLIHIPNNSNAKMLCVCPNCGNEIEMWASHFYRGSNSCKCKNLKRSNPRLYGIWTNMKTRCSNPNFTGYADYGGRGITVCEEWQAFEPFYKWAMANGYREDLTIDRINVNGNYEPMNCRWVDNFAQANNKRDNVIVVLDGQEMSLKKACDSYGFNYKTEHTYLSRHGIEAEMARLMDKLMELEGMKDASE